MSDSLQPHGLQYARLLRPWDSAGKNTGVGGSFLPQGIFPGQGSNPHLLQLPHCRQSLYGWATGKPNGLPFPSPRDLPNPGIEPRSPTLQADVLTSEPPGSPYFCLPEFKWYAPITAGEDGHKALWSGDTFKCTQSFGRATGEFLTRVRKVTILHPAIQFMAPHPPNNLGTWEIFGYKRHSLQHCQ